MFNINISLFSFSFSKLGDSASKAFNAKVSARTNRSLYRCVVGGGRSRRGDNMGDAR